MDCSNCSIMDVCTVAEMIKKHSLQMDIEVTNCQIKSSLKNTYDACESPAKPLTPVKEYKDFRVISNELRDKEKGADCNIKISTENTSDLSPLERTKCPNCGAETTPDDIKPCDGDGCLTVTCSNCRTENEGKNYCDTCWTKL